MRAPSEVTAVRLRELLNYDPQTGIFTRRIDIRQRWKAGSVAGNIAPSGYVRITIDGRSTQAHRLAWLWMTGAWPDADIDHINGDRADNRWANLRDVTRTVNMQNLRGAFGNNKSGLLGAGWDKARRKWMAVIWINGQRHHLGRFDSPEGAHLAYLSAKRLHHAGNTL